MDARPVYAQAKTVGMIYQAAFRAEIEAATSLRFGPVDGNGQAELIGVDPRVVEVFSSRSAEIDVAMGEWKAGWAQAHDGELPDTATQRAMANQMALGTRSTKPAEEHSTEELLGRWRDQVIEHGLQPDQLFVPAVAADPVDVVTPAVVVQEVGGVAAVFSRDDVARAVARHTTGTDAADVVATVEAVTAQVLAECVTVEAVGGPVRDSDGRPTLERPGTPIHTTTATLDMEARVLRWCETSGARTVDHADTEGLDPSQAAAVETVLGDGNQVSVIVGPAGHGKTTTVARVADAWRAEHGDVIGLAPSAQASRLLADAGIEAETVDAWLLNPQLPVRGMVIVDEAGMVGTAHLDRLRAHAVEVGVKVVLVGDPEQLAAVRKAGGVLADVVEAAPLPGNGLSVSELGVAHRFQNDTAAAVAAGLRDRDPAVIGILEDAGWLHGHQTPDTARTAVLDAAWTDAHRGLDTVMLVGTRADAAALNQQWQTRRVLVGELHPDTRHPRTGYMDGDLIVAKQNRRDIEWTAPDGEPEWLRNGTRVTVEHQGADGAILGRTSDGGRVMIDGDYAKTNTQLGYARTIHSAQGATVDTAHVLLGPSTESHGLYVAGSRARHATHLHAAQPTVEAGEYAAPAEPRVWSAGDAVVGAMEQVDPGTRSAHRQMREHRAEQVEAIVARYDGITPPAYPDPAERDRLTSLIERTGRHNTPAAATQVRTLTRQLAAWTTQHDTATAFDQQPGAVDYRNHWQQQIEQQQAPKIEHTQDHGMEW
ncbi:MAG: AAA family ATPase [Acidimicrobiales bacterium]